MDDASQIQGSDQSYRTFLLHIANQVQSLIKKNRPRFERQVRKFETQYSDHRKVLVDAQRQARLKVNSHLRHEPGKQAPKGYVLYDINKNTWQFPRKMVSFYISKAILKRHPDPLDTLIERDGFTAMFNSWDSQRRIDYNKNGKKTSDLPGEEICTREEGELRQYFLLSVIHAFMTDESAVVGRNSKPALFVWDRFDYQRFTSIGNLDRAGEKAFIQTALENVRQDINTIQADIGGAREDETPKLEQPAYSIQKTAEHYTFFFDGKKTTVNNLLGCKYLEILLTNPGQEYAPSELRRAVAEHEAGKPVIVLCRTAQYLIEDGPDVIQKGIDRLSNDLENTDDPQKKIKKQNEMLQMKDLLNKSLNNKKGSRMFADNRKDSVAVQRNIETTKSKIKIQNSLLYSHIDNFVQTGMACRYSPDKEIIWEIV